MVDALPPPPPPRARAEAYRAGYRSPLGRRRFPRAAAGRPDHPAWWLLPAVMGWLGGVIAWRMMGEADPRRGRAMLVTGIVASVVWFGLYTLTVPGFTT